MTTPAVPGVAPHLFVMTYGRSGSTLVQALLNSIPGYLVRGENGGILTHLHAFHQGALAGKAPRGERARSPNSPWFGIVDYPDEVALAQIRELVTRTLLRPEPDTRVTGFKEIRWYMDDLASYVAFLRAVFPGARFVVNTREIADVARSGWWAKQEDPEQTIGAIEERILAVASTLGDDSFHLVYDEYVADPEALRPFFAWLGEDFDLDRARDVLSVRYSPSPGAAPRRQD